MGYKEPKLMIRDIDQELRRRKAGKITAEIPRPVIHGVSRELGKTDITDIPTDTPYQKLVLDQTGKIYPMKTHWWCRKCGHKTLFALPPKVCPRCGKPSVLSELNLRR